MRAWLIGCSLLLVACDDPEPPAPTEIVDTTTSPEETRPPDPPPVSERDDETPRPEAPRATDDDESEAEDAPDDDELLADGEDDLDDEEDEASLRFGAVRARDVELRHRRLVDELAAALSRASHAAAAARSGGIDEDDMSIEASGSCRGAWIGKDLVQIGCMDRVINREDWSEQHVTHLFAVADGELAPIAPDSLFTSREAIHARLAERCRQETTEEALEEAERTMPYRASCDAMFLELGQTRVYGRFAQVDYDGNSPEPYEGPSLRYEEVAALIPEGGTLRRMLAGETPPTPSAPATPDAIGVSHVDLPHRLWGAWQALPDEDRARLALHPVAPGLARLVLIGDDASTAARLAGQLGASPRPLELPSTPTPYAPGLRVVRQEMFLRAFPDPHAPVLGVLPVGTVVAQTDPRATDRYVEVETPLGHGGLGRNLLREAPACVPRAPEGFEPPVLTVLTPLRRGASGRVDGVVFAGSVGAYTRAVFHELRAGCALGPERLRHQAPGRLRDLRVTSAAENGGPSIVVVGVVATNAPHDEDEETEVRYTALAVGAEAPVWTATMPFAFAGRPRVRVAETADGVFFPVSVTDYRRGSPLSVVRHAWTGSTLEVRAPGTE